MNDTTMTRKSDPKYDDDLVNKRYVDKLTDNLNKNIHDVIESGSNTKGTWIKYDDGIMVCTRNITFSSITINRQWGAWYVYDNRTFYDFAHEFVSPPIIQKTLVTTSDAGAVLGDYGGSTVTKAGFSGWSLMRPTTHTVTGSIYVTATGRWK